MNSDRQRHATSGRTRKKILRVVLVLLMLFVCAGAIVQVVLDPPQSNELGMRGYLEVEAETGDVEVYIGDEYIGNGTVQVTWDRLLGASGAKPLAIPLADNVPSPREPGAEAHITKALVGPDGEFLWNKPGMSGRGTHVGGDFEFSWNVILWQRANRELDAVSVFYGECIEQQGPWRRFLIPVRLRSNGKNPEYFFDSQSGQVSSRSGGPIPTSIVGPQLSISLIARPGSPPEEFADEIARSGLWSPPR